MPDRPSEPLTPGVPTSVTCPSCGVEVAVGYPRCPRCHATVPQAAGAARPSVREAMLAGGTSVEPAGGGSLRMPLVLIGLAGLAILLLVIWLATRKDEPAAAPASDEVEAVEDDDEAELEEGEAPGGAPAVERRPAPAADDRMPAAIRELDEALRAAQLWSNVRREDDVVVVESALCEDATMWPTIAPLAAQLGDAGATAVRCQAPHGGVVFERQL